MRITPIPTQLTQPKTLYAFIPRDKELSPKDVTSIQDSTKTKLDLYTGSTMTFNLVVLTAQSSLDEEAKLPARLQALQLVRDKLGVAVLPSDIPVEDEGAVHIPVPARYAGGVIGKGAIVVREMEEKSGAKITLSKAGNKVNTINETIRYVSAQGKSLNSG